ncbi:MAG: hypothetical protein QOK15_1713, partial [Nocardioidaceae bacterium]|nr:hypothetical protein [Nocardioidaceae bacterium]
MTGGSTSNRGRFDKKGQERRSRSALLQRAFLPTLLVRT